MPQPGGGGSVAHFYEHITELVQDAMEVYSLAASNTHRFHEETVQATVFRIVQMDCPVYGVSRPSRHYRITVVSN